MEKKSVQTPKLPRGWVTRVAKECGVSRSTVYRYMDEVPVFSQLTRAKHEHLVRSLRNLRRHKPPTITQ